MPFRSLRARVTALCAAAVVATGLPLAAPAQAADRATPGSFTGFAFDACQAPTQAEMNAWRTSSPYWGVGVYIGGSNRLCSQPDLDATWVRTQTNRGWRVLPIWVGPQAACTGYDDVIDDRPGSSYAAARKQGRHQAWVAARTSRDLGIARGSTLWYDMEDFPLQESDDCRRSALSFLSAWTRRLHEIGFASGVYANVASAIHALDYADTVSPRAYAEPDQIWYAWHNDRADTRIDEKWVRPDSWTPHRRIHQYTLDHTAGYGGVSLDIDSSFMDVGRGSVAPADRRHCGVRVDFARYRRLTRGDRGAQVQAAQCLLRQKGYDVTVTGRFTRPTYRATRAFQRSHALRVTGRMTSSTWTALLSAGRGPVVKRGSVGDAVRRVQRALNAATDARLTVTGVYNRATTRAVTRYQRGVDLPRTGVVAPDTWDALRSGRV
jgi:hypothetical protein